MWRRYSRGSKDIRRLSKDMGADERGERLDCYQLDGMSHQPLQEIGESHEAIEALLARGELDEEVNIAVRAGLTASHGAEECKAPDAELANLRFGCKQALNCLVPGRG